MPLKRVKKKLSNKKIVGSPIIQDRGGASNPNLLQNSDSDFVLDIPSGEVGGNRARGHSSSGESSGNRYRRIDE